MPLETTTPGNNCIAQVRNDEGNVVTSAQNASSLEEDSCLLLPANAKYGPASFANTLTSQGKRYCPSTAPDKVSTIQQLAAVLQVSRSLPHTTRPTVSVTSAPVTLPLRKTVRYSGTVGAKLGREVGCADGGQDGRLVGCRLGCAVGLLSGCKEGLEEGWAEGAEVGCTEG